MVIKKNCPPVFQILGSSLKAWHQFDKLGKVYKFCGVCHRRLKAGKKRRKLGVPSTWKKASDYGLAKGRVFNRSDYVCGKCHVCLMMNKTDGIVPLKDENEMLTYSEFQDSSVSEMDLQDSLASSCSSNEESQISQLSKESILSEVSANSSCQIKVKSSKIQINVKSVHGTESNCFICKARKKNRIPKSAIVDLWFRKKILVPITNRSCPCHLANGLFKPEIVDKIKLTKGILSVTGKQVTDVLNLFKFEHVPHKSIPAVDFDSPNNYSSEDYEQLTGLSKKNFDNLFSKISHRLRDSYNRSRRNSLGLFMMKLKLDLSQEVLAILFRFSSQARVSETFDSVMKAMEIFVSENLGYSHKSREESKVHQTKYTHALFEAQEDALIVIADGTYLNIQQPSDFELQKKTYCMHKHSNILKPMMLVYPDGYIINAEGLYFSNSGNNDASIMKAILIDENGFKNYFNPGDVAIVDRGFRDAVTDLEELGLRVFMPRFLKKDQKQFSTAEANYTRQITMLRWVVEAINGLAKRFKMFRSKIENSYIPKLRYLFRIVCALLNAYSPPLFSDDEDHVKMAEAALRRMEMENDLEKAVEPIERMSVCWARADKYSIPEFPKLTEEDLKLITLGVYQIKLAKLYTRQHLSTDSSYEIYVHKEDTGFIRAKIHSRLTSGKSHQLWIKFDNKQDKEQSILAWYCKCRVGARTVGCCSHICSVIWYLGFARHCAENLCQSKRGIADDILDAAKIISSHVDESTDSQ